MTRPNVRHLAPGDLLRVWEIFCQGSEDVASQERYLPFDPAGVDRGAFLGDLSSEIESGEHLHLNQGS